MVDIANVFNSPANPADPVILSIALFGWTPVWLVKIRAICLLGLSQDLTAVIEYNCERCGATIKIRPKERLVICRECGVQQDWAPTGSNVDGDDRPEPDPAVTNRTATPDRVPIPENLNIQDDGYRLTIRRRWYTTMIWFLVFFCIAWDSFLLFWYSIAFDGDAPWIMAVFPIVHVAVGVGLTYYTLATLLNTTTITIEGRKVSVRHNPVPWKGNRTFSAGDITQLYCAEAALTSSDNNGPTQHYYDVCLLDANNRKLKLLSNLSSKEEALAIEKIIEERLGLDDEVVAGEIEQR